MSARRTIPVLACTAMVATACSLPGAPEPTGGPYPSKTVTVIVPYAAGGPTDLAARAMSECLSEELDQRFIVQNRDGGAGSIGTLEMLTSQPNGYTLGVGTTGSVVIAPLLSEHATYTPAEVTPLTKIYQLDSAILVLDDSKYTSARDFFEEAEKKKGSVTIAVGGASTEYALELRRMAKEYGVELSIVPFDGGAPAQNALLGGNVDALFAAVNQQVAGLIKDGTVRALATGGQERSELLPKKPTLAELGFKNLTNTTTFFALVGPDDMDPEVVGTLRDASGTCLDSKGLRDQLGADFIPTTPGTPKSIAKEWSQKSADAKKVLQ